jgi:hypothetical protein
MDIELADSLSGGWRLWHKRHLAVAPDNKTEIEALEADGGRYLGYARVVGRKRQGVQLEEPIMSISAQYTRHPVFKPAPDQPFTRPAVTALPMRITIIIAIIVIILAALKLFYHRVTKPGYLPQTTITQAWWDGLSEEWKTILVINQNFRKHHVNIFTLQREYMNRLNAPGEREYSEMNTSLYELNEMRRFNLKYTDLYEMAIRKQYLTANDRIDLATLGNLDTLYMVSGPGDLAPLEKFPRLKVLILNYCGVDPSAPGEQKLDVEPVKYLKELKVFHCASIALTSLAPLENLVNLEELRCDNSKATSLAPIRNLDNLKRLSCGPNLQNTSAVSRLVNLEELHLQECTQIPDLRRLKKLKKLFVSESELSLVDARYRTRNLDFLKHLPALEFLDLDHTSYRGSLERLYDLPNLKAVTLPPVSSDEARAFKKANQNCQVINSIAFGE